MEDRVVSHEEVLRHVYDFLRAHGYKNSLLALQSESRVPYNTIDATQRGADSEGTPHIGPEELEREVLEGNWDVVLSTYVDALLLPNETVFNIYELIFEELLTLRGFVHAARAFFTNSPVFIAMKRSSSARYARLHEMLARYKSDAEENNGVDGSGSVPPHVVRKRELVLKSLQEAITWNYKPYDGTLPAAVWRLRNDNWPCHRDATPSKRQREEEGDDGNRMVHSGNGGAVVPVVCSASTAAAFLHYPICCPKKIFKKVDFSGNGNPAVCHFLRLPQGDTTQNLVDALVVGKTEGAVDFLSVESTQPLGNSLGHTDGVLCVSLDSGTENAAAWVAFGYRDGWVKIYNTESRKLVRRFPQVHSSGVTSVVFAGLRSGDLSGHYSHIVSGSYDGSIQLLNIRSGTSMQRIGDAHRFKYVLSLCVTSREADEAHFVVSAGNDSALCFWRFLDDKLQRVGQPRALSTIQASLKNDIPTRLLPVDDSEGCREVVVLTRSQCALVLSVCFAENVHEPVVVALLCVINTPRPLFSGCLRVFSTQAQQHPVLSVFLTDKSGTVMLYNVVMRWRASAGAGALLEHEPADECSVVVVECGKPVEDLCVLCIPVKPDMLLVYSQSLSTMFFLTWE